MQCWQVAACLCTLRLPSHASSWLLFPFPCLFKSEETLRPFAKHVLGPPAGTLRGPTCSFTCALQAKLALGLKNAVFTATFGGPQGAPGRAPRGLQEASLQPCPQEAPRRPPRGPQVPGFANGPCAFCISGEANFGHTLWWFLHLRLQGAPLRASKW